MQLIQICFFIDLGAQKTQKMHCGTHINWDVQRQDSGRTIEQSLWRGTFVQSNCFRLQKTTKTITSAPVHRHSLPQMRDHAPPPTNPSTHTRIRATRTRQKQTQQKKHERVWIVFYNNGACDSLAREYEKGTV